jgi:hypothetical protein
LDEALEADGALTSAVEYLELERFPRFFHDFALLEPEVLSPFSYNTHVLHGLLQTEDYARAVISSRYPPLSEDEAERMVGTRVDRKALLTRDPVALMSFVIEESVLRCPIGGAQVMRAQLAHLVECSKARNICIQVMPLANGGHAGLDGPMTVLETPEHRTLVYLETQEESILLSGEDEVAIRSQRYGMIRSQALSPEESVEFIQRLAGELYA